MNELQRKFVFAVALVLGIVLGVAMGCFVWRRRTPVAHETSAIVAKGPTARAHSGTTVVEAPPPLTPVQWSQQRLQAIGVTTAEVERKAVSKELRVPGNVDINQRKVAYVQTRFSGWIKKVYANADYQHVRKGEPLFTVYSPDLFSTEQEYLLARQIQSPSSIDTHSPAADDRDWLLKAARDRLQQFGVPASELARLERTKTAQHDITINSPVTGYITELNARPNQYIEVATKLYTIADLSTVWVYANVYQIDIGQLRPGISAVVTVDAYPGQVFHGRIEQILPKVDPATRTVHVRFAFDNPRLELKPGMFVNITISVPLGHQLVIPSSGILQTGARQIAFIDRGGGRIEPREVETGSQLDDHVIVLKGLKAGDRIVTSANFLVDSEAQLQAALGAFSPPPPGAGAAASMNDPFQNVAVIFSSRPSPLQKGKGTIRITLRSADGNPVTGSQVQAIFYMPAMPAMGMAAVRITVVLTDEGNGVYEGSLELPSGGSYRVTITAVRNGQTIASKKIGVNATGGM